MKNQIRQMISRPGLQSTWLQLLKLCHAGLNYGGGQSVEWSGEIGALRFAVNAISDQTRPVTVFDIGANDGEYLQIVHGVLGDRARIFSFEPQSSSFAILRQRFGDNPHVELRNVALGKEIAEGKLFFSTDRQSTASIYESSASGSIHTETIQLTTLDHFCREEAIQQVDLLKIDTEGHEMDVLLGASGLLDSGRIGAVQFEFGETFLQTGYHFCDIFELLSPRYVIYRVLRRGLVEIKNYSHDLEVYKLSNFMCILKPVL